MQIVANALAGIANPALAAAVAMNHIPTPAQQMAQSLNALRASMMMGLQSIQRFTASILSMAKAGLEGTVEGYRLSFAWLLLSKQIAAIFIPVVNLATSAIIGLRNIMASFSGTTQNMALVVGGLAGAFLPFLGALSQVLPLIGTITKLFSPFRVIMLLLASAATAFLSSAQGAPLLAALGKALDAVMNLFGSLASLFGDVITVAVELLVGVLMLLEPFITLVVKGLTLLANGLKWVFDKIRSFLAWLGFGAKELDKGAAPRRDVTPAKFSFEGIGDAMERITLAANKTALLDIPRKQLEEQEKANKSLEGLRQDVQKIQPAVVR